jgi:hypothetical protein
MGLLRLFGRRKPSASSPNARTPDDNSSSQSSHSPGAGSISEQLPPSEKPAQGPGMLPAGIQTSLNGPAPATAPRNNTFSAVPTAPARSATPMSYALSCEPVPDESFEVPAVLQGYTLQMPTPPPRSSAKLYSHPSSDGHYLEYDSRSAPPKVPARRHITQPGSSNVMQEISSTVVCDLGEIEAMSPMVQQVRLP